MQGLRSFAERYTPCWTPVGTAQTPKRTRDESRRGWRRKGWTFGSRALASPTIGNANRCLEWLREMDMLRRACRTSATVRS